MSTASNIFAKSVSIIIGLMFLAGGLFFFLKFDPAAYDQECTGTIVEIYEHYETAGDDNQLIHDVYIDYTIEDKTYEHVAFFEYNNAMKVGDKVKFYYMSEDPTQIAGEDKGLTPYFGLGFAVIGLVMLVVTGVKIIIKKPI